MAVRRRHDVQRGPARYRRTGQQITAASDTRDFALAVSSDARTDLVPLTNKLEEPAEVRVFSLDGRGIKKHCALPQVAPGLRACRGLKKPR